MKQPCQKWQGCWCYGLAQGCGEMPDKSLGRSIAPRGSSRSNCQVKAILHGGIETGAKMRGRHRGVERRGAQRERNERLFVVISTSSPITEMNPSNLLPHLAGHMCNGGCFFAKRVNPLFYAPICLPYASIQSHLRA